jgi:hypothetical protein
MPAKPNGPCDCRKWAHDQARLLLDNFIEEGWTLPAYAAIAAALLKARSEGEAIGERRGRVAGLREAAEMNGNDPDFPYKAMCKIMARANALEASE